MISGRDKTIDVAKGICILMMPLAHLFFLARHKSIIEFNDNYLVVFKLPFFVIISGYLFSEKGSLRDFVKMKIDRYLKPVFSIFILSSLILSFSLLKDGFFDTQTYFLRSITFIVDVYYPLWFVFALCFAQIVFRFLLYVVNKTFGREFLLLFVALIIFSMPLLPHLIYEVHLKRFFYVILYFTVFIYIGYLIKREGFMDKLLGYKALIGSAILFILYIAFMDLLSIDVYLWMGIFEPFVPATIVSLSGTVLLLNISKLISKNNFISKLLFVFSRSSLFILSFHVLLGNFFIYPLFRRYFNESLAVDVIGFLVTILLCLPFRFIIMRIKYFNNLILPVRI